MKPHVVIGDNYLERWHLVPRNRWINVYLHKFSGSDDDRASHDHPWWSVSFLLRGSLMEYIQTGWMQVGEGVVPEYLAHWVPRFLPQVRPAVQAHRLELIEGPAWTLFITGPKVREWGFFCPKGWKHWSLMSTEDGRPIGGCE